MTDHTWPVCTEGFCRAAAVEPGLSDPYSSFLSLALLKEFSKHLATQWEPVPSRSRRYHSSERSNVFLALPLAEEDRAGLSSLRGYQDIPATILSNTLTVCKP